METMDDHDEQVELQESEGADEQVELQDSEGAEHLDGNEARDEQAQREAAGDEETTVSDPMEGVVSKRYSDPQANIVFVSEDGVKFRVHDYMLKAAS